MCIRDSERRVESEGNEVARGAGDEIVARLFMGEVEIFAPRGEEESRRIETVSYTHLTLPTSDLV